MLSLERVIESQRRESDIGGMTAEPEATEAWKSVGKDDKRPAGGARHAFWAGCTEERGLPLSLEETFEYHKLQP